MSHDTIWKYPIPIEDEFELTMPAGARPLSVGVQGGEPVLWAAVDSHSAREETRHFHLRGTGHPLNLAAPGFFIGTFQIERLGLVFHLFDGGWSERRDKSEPLPEEQVCFACMWATKSIVFERENTPQRRQG